VSVDADELPQSWRNFQSMIHHHFSTPIMQRRVFLPHSAVTLVCLLASPAQARAPQTEVIGQAHRWLMQNPPDGTNAAARRQRMTVAQQACDWLPGGEYRSCSKTAGP